MLQNKTKSGDKIKENCGQSLSRNVLESSGESLTDFTISLSWSPSSVSTVSWDVTKEIISLKKYKYEIYEKNPLRQVIACDFVFEKQKKNDENGSF